MKILITGDEGFVGREFHRQLAGKGHDILGLDIKSGNDCRTFFRNDDLHDHYDLVIHLAAIVGGRQKIENQPLAVATDLSIDAEMFNWAARSKPTRVVYFSSSAAYPINLQSDSAVTDGGWQVGLQEHEINLSGSIGEPDMSYGWSKLTGEFLVPYLKAEGVKVYTFRPFSGYGEDQDLDYPFPSFIFRGAKRQDPFVIWGDGEQSRDFIHIEDIVKGVFAAIDADVQDPVNLCTGRKTTFNQLAELVTEAAGYSPEFHHILDAPKGVYCRVGNPWKMLEFYTPKITLEEGVARALKSPKFA